MNITLDDNHVYRVSLGGDIKEVPSVTTIMRDVGYYPWVFRDKDEHEIHFPTENIDRGIEVDPIAKELLPYVQAYRQFKSDNEITITNIEEIVFCEEFWYAGALDRVMTINDCPAIVDIKTGTKLTVTGIQLAAYQYAWEQMGGEKNLNRFALHLKDTGAYKLVPYRNKEDLSDFLAAVRVYKRKRQT